MNTCPSNIELMKMRVYRAVLQNRNNEKENRKIEKWKENKLFDFFDSNRMFIYATCNSKDENSGIILQHMSV